MDSLRITVFGCLSNILGNRLQVKLMASGGIHEPGIVPVPDVYREGEIVCTGSHSLTRIYSQLSFPSRHDSLHHSLFCMTTGGMPQAAGARPSTI